MPNRCNNSIEIHTKCPLDKFMTKTKSGHRTLHFAKLLPLEGERGHHKANELWWTKRDIYSEEHDNDKRINGHFEIESCVWIPFISGGFDTARSPPTVYYDKLLEVLLEHDPDSTINAEYNEWGMWFFWGRYNWDDYYYEYDNIHRCATLEEYVVTAEWDELSLRGSIYGDWRYYPKDALENLESGEYWADDKVQLNKDIKMCKDFISKQTQPWVDEHTSPDQSG